MNKISVKDIVLAVGEETLIEKLGVIDSSIRTARAKNQMPSGWYKAVKELCDAIEQPCPMCLFNFREKAATAA